MGDALEVKASEIVGNTAPPDWTVKIKKYDFKRPDKFSLEQIRTMQLVHEGVARALVPVLSTRVGTNVQMEVACVDQLAFYEFFPSVPKHALFAPIGLSPLKGSALLEIDPVMANVLLGTAVGQPFALEAAAAEASARYTEAERVVLGAVIEAMLPSFREGWANMIDIAPSVISVESDPRDCMIVPPTEMIILVGFKVTVGDVEAFINLAIPYLTIEPIISKLSAMYWYSSVRRGRARELTTTDRTWDLNVECDISLPAGAIALADLPAVLGGQSIPLPDAVETGAFLTAGGVDVARLEFAPEQLEGDRMSARVLEQRRPSMHRADAPAPAEPMETMRPMLDEISRGINDLRVTVREMQDAGAETLEDQAYETSAVRTISPENAADLGILLDTERPALVAFVLAAIEEQSAARILSGLSTEKRAQVVRSLTTLAAADRGLHRRLTSFLLRRVQSSRENNVIGGPSIAASVLNHVPVSVEKEVMTRFQSEDMPLFESIAQLMFVFEDFELLDAVAIGKLAERVEPAELALALKGVAGNVVKHIEAALPADYLDEVRAEEESLGRVRKRDVESAQKDIIEELRVLEAEGGIVVARPDEIVE